MFAPYRDILALPGAKSFVIWGLISRIPMGVTGLATFMLFQIEYNSYKKAGAALAILAVSNAIVSPQVARLIDRYGQRRVLRYGFAISIVGRVSVLLLVLNDVSFSTAVLMLPLFTAHGTLSTLNRARWGHLLPDRHRLNTAFSLESSLEEVLFISGPALATILATQVASWVPSTLAIAAIAIGGYRYIELRDTEPPVRSHEHRTAYGKSSSEHSRVSSSFAAERFRQRLRNRLAQRGSIKNHLLFTTPALVLTALVFAAQGALFSSADAATVAMSEELGQKAFSGVVLAIFALGSLVGGLFYGARTWNSSLASRLLFGVTITGVGAASFVLAPNLVVLSIAMFITGLVIAPTMAIGDGVVHALIPRANLTEGMTWTRTGIDIGVATGASLVGIAIESGGSHAGFLVTAAAGFVGFIVVACAWSYLRKQPHYEEVHEDSAAVLTAAN